MVNCKSPGKNKASAKKPQSSTTQDVTTDHGVHITVSTSATPASSRCKWSSEDERAFIDFLIEHKAEAGDNGFTNKIFQQAATVLQTRGSSGGLKTARTYKNKYARVRSYMLLCIF